ncbi:MAG: hypothetical protein WBD09_00380 [Halobacteriota archaeon]
MEVENAIRRGEVIELTMTITIILLYLLSFLLVWQCQRITKRK